jgi:hypothetical protein
MFIREPTADKAVITGDGTAQDLVAFVAEATLIESIDYVVSSLGTDAGYFHVLLLPPNPGTAVIIHAFDIAAWVDPANGLAGGYLTGKIALDRVLPVGYGLQIAHAVKVTIGGADANIDVTAFGGIVR